MAQEEGFSPLAARPAPTLPTSSFAFKQHLTIAPQGKAFCSRKTAISNVKTTERKLDSIPLTLRIYLHT
jgi:hypothetical protein